MAPIQSDSESNADSSSISGAAHRQPAQSTNARQNDRAESVGKEFHTEESSGSEEEDSAGAGEGEEDDAELDTVAPGVPLLPDHLLQQLAKPPQHVQSLSDLAWDQLTPKQKRSRRNNSRKMKKRQYDRLREEVKGTGVLGAGKAAQEKRGVVSVKRDRTVSGRVAKTGSKGVEKVRVSGRQHMVEQRKRAVEHTAEGMRRPGKKARTSSKR